YLFKNSRSFGYKVFSDRAKDVEGTPLVVHAYIHINEGESLLEIGKDLEEKYIVRDKWVFAASVRFMDGYDKIGEGDYELSSSMKPSEILKVLTTKEETENE
ncbi:MAG: endolytic transglycosylase MltG, partial [Eubacterium sp.]|nr:endolytic transglycosylase MltG [Eubacterium sp.]